MVNGRLSFKSSIFFRNTLVFLESKTDAQLKNWLSNKNFTSLYESVDLVNLSNETLKRFPNNYQGLLNKDGEVLIGDTIVWYSVTGEKHYIPNANESFLAKMKENPAIDMNSAKYELVALNVNLKNGKLGSKFSPITLNLNTKTGISDFILGSERVDARY